MKTEHQRNPYLATLRHAARALDGGDPETAVEYLETAIALAPDMDSRKTCEKAHEEANIGSVDKAETLVEMAIQDCKTPVCKPSNSGAAHTPGIWHVEGVGKTRESDIEPPHVRVLSPHANSHGGIEKQIAVVYYGETDAERESNAKLIAAAPDLLAACVHFAENYASRGIGKEKLDAVFHQCHAAIAKAKGTK